MARQLSPESSSDLFGRLERFLNQFKVAVDSRKILPKIFDFLKKKIFQKNFFFEVFNFRRL